MFLALLIRGANVAQMHHTPDRASWLPFGKVQRAAVHARARRAGAVAYVLGAQLGAGDSRDDAPESISDRLHGGRGWSGARDLNPRPHGPEPCALPNCASPRRESDSIGALLRTLTAGAPNPATDPSRFEVGKGGPGWR